MATPSQEFSHALDPVKGYDVGHNVLDFADPLSPNVTFDPVPAGRVVHHTSVGFEMGATGHQMPIFLIQNSNDPDVTRDQDTAQGIQGISGGVMSGLVATGGYELASTEFDKLQTYHENDLLRGQSSNTVAATGGVLTNQGITLYTNCVCGLVSRGVRVNSHNVSELVFWSVFLPGSGS